MLNLIAIAQAEAPDGTLITDGLTEGFGELQVYNTVSIDKDTGVQTARTILVTLLDKWLERILNEHMDKHRPGEAEFPFDLKVAHANIDPEMVEKLVHEGTVEKQNMYQFEGVDPDKMDPIVICELPDKTHMIVDGNHRYVYAAMMGKTHIFTVVVPMPVWECFCLPEPLENDKDTILSTPRNS